MRRLYYALSASCMVLKVNLNLVFAWFSMYYILLIWINVLTIVIKDEKINSDESMGDVEKFVLGLQITEKLFSWR